MLCSQLFVRGEVWRLYVILRAHFLRQFRGKRKKRGQPSRSLTVPGACSLDVVARLEFGEYAVYVPDEVDQFINVSRMYDARNVSCSMTRISILHDAPLAYVAHSAFEKLDDSDHLVVRECGKSFGIRHRRLSPD